uniref:Uncharacterized protein n=1 Tax=Chrysotila carterae TaxID=13221 RepID=A0A6S9TI00_CHRCT|mmetsp:Transcript_5063/g.10996  ORF Transcript_5063/g.10996 Transcript_5063/m.10996 type:complete len:285 (-) Transcript_5063:208-1062(-)
MHERRRACQPRASMTAGLRTRHGRSCMRAAVCPSCAHGITWTPHTQLHGDRRTPAYENALSRRQRQTGRTDGRLQMSADILIIKIHCRHACARRVCTDKCNQACTSYSYSNICKYTRARAQTHRPKRVFARSLCGCARAHTLANAGHAAWTWRGRARRERTFSRLCHSARPRSRPLASPLPGPRFRDRVRIRCRLPFSASTCRCVLRVKGAVLYPFLDPTLRRAVLLHLALMSAMATFFVLGAAADAAASRMPAAMRIAVVYAGCAAIMRTRTIRGIPQVHKQA